MLNFFWNINQREDIKAIRTNHEEVHTLPLTPPKLTRNQILSPPITPMHTVSTPRHMHTDSVQEKESFIIFGLDLSNLNANTQFYISASGVFLFTIIYGYLQELISVHIAGRKFPLFISTCQFAGYAFWSYILMRLEGISKTSRTCQINKVYSIISSDTNVYEVLEQGGTESDASLISRTESLSQRSSLSLIISSDESSINTQGSKETYSLTGQGPPHSIHEASPSKRKSHLQALPQGSISDECNMDDLQSITSHSLKQYSRPKLRSYILLSVIRAVDVGMTNGAMRYLNYPMKTLIKSSRVAFTMVGGIVIGTRQYSRDQYITVVLLVLGLCIFIHADMHTSSVFHPLGIVMLATSLLCDGVVANYSELIMREHDISQDELQFNLYSMAFISMLSASIFQGELKEGFGRFFLVNGAILETDENLGGIYFWTIKKKIMAFVLFTFCGLCGSSCAGAITKRFGALSMSITSTTRKAFTLFLSFVAFKSNKCTGEHLAGMGIFIGALLLKHVKKYMFEVFPEKIFVTISCEDGVVVSLPRDEEEKRAR